MCEMEAYVCGPLWASELVIPDYRARGWGDSLGVQGGTPGANATTHVPQGDLLSHYADLHAKDTSLLF